MKRYLWFACCVSALGACEMQREFEVDIPEEKEKLVVNCVFVEGRKWTAEVYPSQGIISLENDKPNNILNAVVRITEGDTEIPLSLVDNSGTYQSSATAEAGKTYTINVSAPGYEPVSSTVTLPPAIQILDVETSLSVDPEDPRSNKRTFHIRFKDPGHELNFYAFGMTRIEYRTASRNEEDVVISGTYLDPLDPAFSKNYYREDFRVDSVQQLNLLFDDRLFDGDEYVLSVSCREYRPTEEFPEEPFLYKLFLKSLTPAYYHYRVTYNLQQETKGDPFAQPVQVFNNIQNGYGIFAGASLAYRDVRVH